MTVTTEDSYFVLDRHPDLPICRLYYTGKFLAHGVTYILWIWKWVRQVYALFSVSTFYFCSHAVTCTQHILPCNDWLFTAVVKKNWSQEVIKHLEMCFLKGDMQRFFTKLMKSSF